MQILFNPHDPADVAAMQAALASLIGAPAAHAAAASPPPPPGAAQAAAAAPPPPAGVQTQAPAAAAATAAPPPPAGHPTDAHAAARQELTDVITQLGPASGQVGGFVQQCGAANISELTLEQLQWVLGQARALLGAPAGAPA